MDLTNLKKILSQIELRKDIIENGLEYFIQNIRYGDVLLKFTKNTKVDYKENNSLVDVVSVFDLLKKKCLLNVYQYIDESKIVYGKKYLYSYLEKKERQYVDFTKKEFQTIKKQLSTKTDEIGQCFYEDISDSISKQNVQFVKLCDQIMPIIQSYLKSMKMP